MEAAEATVKELGNQREVVAFRDNVYVIADPVTAIKVNSLIDEVRLTQTGVAESKHKTSAFCPRESFSEGAPRGSDQVVLGDVYLGRQG